MPQQHISDDGRNAIDVLLDLNIGVGINDDDHYHDQHLSNIV